MTTLRAGAQPTIRYVPVAGTYSKLREHEFI